MGGTTAVGASAITSPGASAPKITARVIVLIIYSPVIKTTTKITAKATSITTSLTTRVLRSALLE